MNKKVKKKFKNHILKIRHDDKCGEQVRDEVESKHQF